MDDYKQQSYPPSQSTVYYSKELTGGLFLCVAWVEVAGSFDAGMNLEIQGSSSRTTTVRGSMLNGGGMVATTFADARSVSRQMNFRVYNGHTEAVEIRTRANIIKLR